MAANIADMVAPAQVPPGLLEFGVQLDGVYNDGDLRGQCQQ